MDKSRKKTGRVPTEEDKKRAVDLFLNRLEQTFVFYFWAKYIQPMLSKHLDFKHYIEAVQNACIQSTLICIRDLDDFFTTADKIFENDLRAQDFIGYKSLGSFLTEEERNKIHHWIVHLTYQGIWTSMTGIAPDKNVDWNLKDLLEKMTRRASHFMDYLIRVHYKDCSKQAEQVKNIKKSFKRRINNMK
jgi:hypothetical protein